MGVSKIMGYLIEGLHNGDYGILRFMLGSRYFGKLPNESGGARIIIQLSLSLSLPVMVSLSTSMHFGCTQRRFKVPKFATSDDYSSSVCWKKGASFHKVHRSPTCLSCKH